MLDIKPVTRRSQIRLCSFSVWKKFGNVITVLQRTYKYGQW